MLTSSFQLDPEPECDVGVELALFSSVFRIDSLADDSKVDEAYSWGVGEYESEDGCDGFWEGL